MIDYIVNGGGSAFSYVKEMLVSGWSPRVLTYAISEPLGMLPFTAWRVIFTVFGCLTAVGISKLVTSKRAALNRTINWVITAFMVIYPWSHMQSAGWVTTTVAYSFQLLFLVVALIPVKKIVRGERIAAWEYVLYIVMTIFAANVEQTLPILALCFLGAIVYLAVKKKTHAFIWVQLILTVAIGAWMVLYTGSGGRVHSETLMAMPDFGMLSTTQKLDMGFARMVYHFFFTPNVMMLVFALLTAVLVFRAHKRFSYRAIGMIPLVAVTFLGVLKSITSTVFPGLNAMTANVAPPEGSTSSLGARGAINLLNFESIQAYLAFGVMVICIVCLLLSMILIWSDRPRKAFLAVLFLLGCMGSVVMMGFSPSVYHSGERTFMYMYFGLIVVGVLLFKRLLKKQGKINQPMIWVLCVCAVLSFGNTIYLIG